MKEERKQGGIRFMHAWMSIISYLSLLLLIMPARKEGIIQTIVLFVLGGALLVWKKPWKKSNLISKTSYLLALIFLSCLGVQFYNRWMSTAQMLLLVEMLHVPKRMLVIIGVVGIYACSIYFMSSVFQQVKVILKSSDKSFASNILFCVIMALITNILVQLMINVDFFSMGIVKFVWGIVIVTIVILNLYWLLGNVKISVILGTGLFMVISTINAYVYSFRGRLFEPVDVFSFGTAMNVADNYSLFPVPYGIISSWGIWVVLIIIFVLRVGSKIKYRISGKQRVILVFCCLIGVISVFVYTTNLKTYHWKKDGAINNGYVLDFVCKFREAYISKPDGYSKERIEELSHLYMQTADSRASKTDIPHIIVIMDESFSDLSIIGEITTNTEVMPFISSLQEDTISGYALTSVYGGNTANSEYEFLTGNSMAWLSPNVVPYQQYMRSETYSMVSYLKENYNYRCIAMHPYLSSGWNRPEAYAQLGFDESFFVEDFPKEHYIRKYVSDQEMFETIVNTYESYQSNPLFLLGVSMQNHGDYSYSGENYNPLISLVGYDNDYSEVEQYLSLVHETDKAVEYLISYFEKVKDNVVIVFFGDHQPKIDENFYREISENSEESLDDQQEKYMVPFFIWSNYDIDEKFVECTSLNYLSSYVYEVAGIPLPPYNQFLAELEAEIPAINANGFYSLDAQGFMKFDMASEKERVWLQSYEQLQYNSLLEEKRRNSIFFPVVK